MYVSCTIGDGLGNRLFQIAAMLGYAERHGHTPVFVKEWIKPNPTQPGGNTIFDYFPTIPIVAYDAVWSLVEWTEIKQEFTNAMTYHDLPHIKGNVKLSGSFQSEKYFPTGGVRLTGLPATVFANPTLFLHVRRGDYLHPFNTHHYVEMEQYYERALGLFPSDANVLVCSDDMAWCKEFLPRRYPFVGANKWIWFHGDEYKTLSAMMACRLGGICANSTFSWWGAYLGLSADMLVTMPSVWIQAREGFPKAVDIYPSWSVRVSV